MNGTMKIAIIVIVAIYLISPIDVMPGPVDDFIVLLLGLASRKYIDDKQ